MDIGKLNEYLLSPAAQVALIIGIAELLKKAGVPAKLIPLIDLVLGLVSGICVYGLILKYSIANGVLIGVAMGLSACGLFSGIKNIVEVTGNDGEEHDKE